MENKYSNYCKPSLEVQFIKKNHTLVGDFLVAVDKVGNDLMSAAKFSLATFLYYFDQNSAPEMYDMHKESVSKFLFEPVKTKEDIVYYSDLMNIHYDAAIKSEGSILQNDSFTEDVLSVVVFENKNEYVFVYTVDYD